MRKGLVDEHLTTIACRFDAEFGLDQARALLRTLQSVIRPCKLRVDFGPPATIDRGALAMLVLTAERQGTAIELHGLSQQDLRVLAYLGIDTQAFESPTTDEG